MKEAIKNCISSLDRSSGFRLLSHYPRYFLEKWRLNGTPDIVFVWIPKSAGTSLAHTLAKEIGLRKLKRPRNFLSFPNRGAVTFAHVHYLSLLKAGLVSWDFHIKAFKFSVVRSPYTRAVSLYNDLRDDNKLGSKTFDEFLDEVALRRPPVGLYNSTGISLANPQVDWLIGEDGGLLVDHVFKLEEIDELRKFFRERYSINLDMKTRHNVSKRFITVDDVLGNKGRVDRINEIYRKDFQVLGYDMA